MRLQLPDVFYNCKSRGDYVTNSRKPGLSQTHYSISLNNEIVLLRQEEAKTQYIFLSTTNRSSCSELIPNIFLLNKSQPTIRTLRVVSVVVEHENGKASQEYSRMRAKLH